MGAIEQEYNELRQLLKDLRAGKITREQANTEICIYSQMERRQKNAIMIQALAVKANNMKPIKALVEQGIIGGKTCIDMRQEEREVETIRCPIGDKIITRGECLDYSGGHMDECNKCHHFNITRKLLIDEAVFVRQET